MAQQGRWRFGWGTEVCQTPRIQSRLAGESESWNLWRVFGSRDLEEKKAKVGIEKREAEGGERPIRLMRSWRGGDVTNKRRALG